MARKAGLRVNIGPPASSSALVVEVDFGINESISVVMADPDASDAEIDAALEGFDPDRGRTVRHQVEEVLRRAGVRATVYAEAVGDSSVRFRYVFPPLFNPSPVAEFLRRKFAGQADVRISVQ